MSFFVRAICSTGLTLRVRFRLSMWLCVVCVCVCVCTYYTSRRQRTPLRPKCTPVSNDGNGTCVRNLSFTELFRPALSCPSPVQRNSLHYTENLPLWLGLPVTCHQPRPSLSVGRVDSQFNILCRGCSVVCSVLFVLSRPSCVQQCSRQGGIGGSNLFYENQCRSCLELHEDFCVHCHVTRRIWCFQH